MRFVFSLLGPVVQRGWSYPLTLPYHVPHHEQCEEECEGCWNDESARRRRRRRCGRAEEWFVHCLSPRSIHAIGSVRFLESEENGTLSMAQKNGQAISAVPSFRQRASQPIVLDGKGSKGFKHDAQKHAVRIPIIGRIMTLQTDLVRFQKQSLGNDDHPLCRAYRCLLRDSRSPVALRRAWLRKILLGRRGHGRLLRIAARV